MSFVNVPQGENEKLKIQKFDCHFVSNPAIVIVAKRGSGKSWVARHLIRVLCDIPIIIVICPSEEHDPFYAKFIPDIFIYYKFDTAILNNIIERQKKATMKATQKLREGKKSDPRILIIMDDCFGENRKWIREPCITEIMNNGRHLNISYILVMQYAMDITPNIRSNFDYVFLLADDTYSNLERLYKQYAGIFPNAESFKQCFKTLTSTYGCMVLIRREASSDFKDKVKYFKAQKVGEIPISKKMLKYFFERYNRNWRNKENDEINIEEFAVKNKKEKNKVAIEIVK